MQKQMSKKFVLGTTFLASLLSLNSASAVPFTLTNGPGDGTVSVGVDGFGSFGAAPGSNVTDAFYDPVGTLGPAGTAFESGVAIGIGGSRTFLSSGFIGSSGGLSNPTVTGTSTSASSSFNFGSLDFSLTQTLVTLTSGSQLDQVYTITNPGSATLDFELIRYLDGDLLFDGSIADGGGRLFLGNLEVLFETDSATGAATSTTFVGITGEGGTIPTTGRFEIDAWEGLLDRIIAGIALDDVITGDGADADEFIDAGNGYDVTLALRNIFSLAPGASTTYTTRTIFGSGAPQSGGGSSVPEPAL